MWKLSTATLAGVGVLFLALVVLVLVTVGPLFEITLGTWLAAFWVNWLLATGTVAKRGAS